MSGYKTSQTLVRKTWACNVICRQSRLQALRNVAPNHAISPASIHLKPTAPCHRKASRKNKIGIIGRISTKGRNAAYAGGKNATTFPDREALGALGVGPSGWNFCSPLMCTLFDDAFAAARAVRFAGPVAVGI